MYARWMTTREIAGHLKDIYDTEVSSELISWTIDSAKELLEDWRSRTLEVFNPIVFLVNVREEGKVLIQNS